MRTYSKLGAAILTAAVGAAAAQADTGPWTLERGEGRVIATGVYSHAAKSYDASGDVQSAPDYDQYQLYLNAEYGVTDDLTVFANPNFGRVAIEGGPKSTGLGFVEVGAKHKLTESDGFVLSAQASAIIPGRSRRTPIAQIGNTSMQYDLRLIGGYGAENGYGSVSGGYRFRSGIEPNEVHVDVSGGIRVAPRFQLTGALYNTWSDGAGRDGFPSYRYSNLYVGGVYDVSDNVSVQLGGLGTVSGRNALRERGVFGGVWLRF